MTTLMTMEQAAGDGIPLDVADYRRPHGKTTVDTDVAEARFIDIVPNERSSTPLTLYPKSLATTPR
jgi:hypothetical protein